VKNCELCKHSGKTEIFCGYSICESCFNQNSKIKNAILNNNKEAKKIIENSIKKTVLVKKAEKIALEMSYSPSIPLQESIIHPKHEELKKEETADRFQNPKQLYDKISESVIGQDHAKRTVSMAIIRHLLRLEDNSIKKQNVLIVGPTGTGKTEISRSVSREVNLPFVDLDSTSMTASGFKGATLSDTIISALMHAAKGKQSLAESGIVFLDEIDKKASVESNEIGTVNIQQELLKILEGGIIRSEIRNKEGQTKNIEFKTENLLFICAGSFSGIDRIIGQKTSISLNGSQKVPADYSKITAQHIIKYGMIPELVGRFSNITYTSPLLKNEFLHILKKKNSIINNYKKIFFKYDARLEFTEEYLQSVVEKVLLENTGARGLDLIIEKDFEKLFFNIEDLRSKSVVIERESVIILAK
jgi:ATP-dependent Clp protease ATP-binding subunit ClpX